MGFKSHAMKVASKNTQKNSTQELKIKYSSNEENPGYISMPPIIQLKI